jgi:DNA invertase Pin-like site-specific DNA recombinase
LENLFPYFGKFISYYRVSTDRQGRSGLGLDAQKEAVQQRLNGGEFVEIESGKRAKRPQTQRRAVDGGITHRCEMC